MSREIKFRCWSNEEGQYFPMQTVNFVDNKIISVGYHKKGHKGFLHMRFPRFVLEQYIGLTDKNGKEIYEGDIVRYDDEYDNICLAVIKCKEEDKENSFWLSGFVYEPFKIIDEEDLTEEEYENLGGIEVIGNIHENPELLEAGK